MQHGSLFVNKHDATEQFVQYATSTPATATGVTVGSAMAWIVGNAPAIISVLTICVLICQLIAWGIRGYRFMKECCEQKKKAAKHKE